ncbi:FtsX-like permease family protein [Couchioplanes azureus]|uniref:FtsX-like permease family protein n=1 Tax=Couchioplanes caeruleus TaxID=56438 RepID=UPI0016701EDD|nr:FtsX-like permease family protein [Couchioplanes caeruleus]GGQ60887.1 hypothetical protein GCM10010166_33190 [Couchioplanes caeruleus subsp. azureus]
MTWLLTLRLLRGGGWAGLARLILMILGFGVGALVVATAMALPTVLDDRAMRSSDRLPNSAMEENAAFGFTFVTDSWHDERFTRVFLAKVKEAAPPPPGLSRFPAPGEIFASPRALQVMRADPLVAERMPGTVVGTIGPSGLLGPNELYAYVGVVPDDLAGGSAGISFGNATPDQSVAEQLGGVSYELMLLMFIPVSVFLVICGRLAARTRAQRYAALRLLGVRRKQTVRMAATEAAVAGVGGAVLGVLSFNSINRELADSKVLGFTWYAEVSRLDLPTAVLLVVIAAAGAAFLGALGLRQSVKKPLQARASAGRRLTVWMLAPLVVGLGLLLPPLISAQSAADARQGVSDTTAYLILAGIAACVVGTMMALRYAIPLLGHSLRGQRYPLFLRVAGARLAADPGSLLRLTSGPVLLVLIAGISAGVLRDAALAAGPTVTARTVVIDTRTVATADQRRAIAATPSIATWRLQQSIVEDVPDLSTPEQRVRGIGMTMVMASCDDVRTMVGQPLPDCREGTDYRFGDPALNGTVSEVPAGVTVKFRNETGQEVAYTTPAAFLPIPEADRTPLGENGVISAAPQPKFGWSPDLSMTFVIGASGADLERFKSAVQRISPTASMHVKQLNLDALEAYRVHRGTVSFGVIAGLGLCLLAFAVAAVDRMVERRREVVALAVLGVRRRTVRVIQIVQLGVPLVGGILLATAVGYLAGNAWLKVNGRQAGWYNGALDSMYPAIGLSVFVCIAVGALVVGYRIKAEDIRRE